MKKKLIYLLMLSAALASCKKEDKLNVDLNKTNPPTYIPGKTDKWLTDNFLNPYNMEVLYRFDRFQAPIDKDLIPVSEDQIQPVMEAVRDIWIDPYMKIAGKNFLKPLIPKQVALVGSAQYNIDGSITLGTAEAGRRVNLFTVNGYNKSNVPAVELLLHTVHHEFIHILHQNIPVPPDFEKISPEYVGGSWVSFTNTAAIAKDLGYITRYSRMNKDEDFAETASTLLVEGQDYYDAYTNTASAAADAKLRKKEQMFVDYLKNSYGLDFRVLQAEVRLAKMKLTGTSRSFNENFRAGVYKSLTVDRNATSQSAAFITAFDAAKTALGIRTGITVDPVFNFDFTNLKVNRTDLVLKFTGTSPTFAGGFWYNVTATVNATNNTVKFTLGTAGSGTEYANGTALQAQFKPLLDYLTTTTFKTDWIENVIPNSNGKLGGFINPTTNQLAFYCTFKR